MKVLVSGGSGYIGSHVVDLLLQQNYEVIIFDLKKPIQPSVNYIEGDILDFEKLNASLENIDVVFNFAGVSDLNYARKFPLECINLNIKGCLNMLMAAKNNGVSKFIQASTVYAAGMKGNYYGISKKSAELFIREFGKRNNLDYLILRFGSIYGPRSNLQNGMHKILADALNFQIFVHNGDLNSEREYVHVLDAARLCLKILESQEVNKNFLISGTSKIKKIDLFNIIQEMLQIKLKLVEETNNIESDHYLLTPYNFLNEIDIKITPDKSIDFQQGLLNLCFFMRDRQNEIK